jgi:multicomponent K+:H+ antiporter subunit E
MTRVLPFPLMSAGLLMLWLLLNQSVSLGEILLGSVLALVGGWTMVALRMPKTRLRRTGTILRLSCVVLADILHANIAVVRILLGFGRQQRTPGFVNIPLGLSDPYALAALACIITSTPGTLWVNFDSQRLLTIHVLDLVDESEWVRTIKGRYERYLLEIFE